MRHRRSKHVFLLLLASALSGLALAQGCSATSPSSGGNGGDGATSSSSGGGASSSSSTSSGQAGAGGGFIIPDGGPGDAPPDVPINPCGTQCGPEELCDADHLGFDDDCDGEVDEFCPCSAGLAHFCFKGDPSYHNAPGCFDGVEKCTENGQFGPCVGGVHATEGCFSNDVTGCHPITSPPFVTVNLKDGTGSFSANAVPGTEVWTVACPPGVSPCPGVGGMNPPDDFAPLQSGEYTVTYTKGLQGGGTDTCTYPLFVGAPGLRVELEWEHNLGGDGVDLDLHVHQPSNTQPWAISGATQDCSWSNCTVSDFSPPQSSDSPKWFSDVAMPPDPVNWFKDPVFEKNTCYFAPRGVGLEWQALGLGCHNPRLDLDNITCNFGLSDPNDPDFCAPENINIDFPPKGEWFRVGVHYYSNHSKNYDVHPKVKIYCDGALAAELGPAGFYDPEAPITFYPDDGGELFGGNRFWMVADVAFKDGGQCGQKGCVVQPLYSDPATKTPMFTLDTAAESSFGPPYPPPP